MSIISVLLSTLIIFSCSQLNGGYRWNGRYEHEGYSGKHYIGSKNGWRNIGKNYAYGNNGNDYIGSINGNGNIGRNNRNGNTGINIGNGNIGNGGEWGQSGLLEGVRPLSCKKDNLCRVFAGIFLPLNVPSTQIDFKICNSQNTCVDGGTVYTFGTICRGVRDINNRNPSPSDHWLWEVEVTHIFRKEASFKGEEDLTARISSIDTPCVIFGLDPVMIYRYNGGMRRGTAYLPQGTRREDYGTMLDKFDNVVET